MSRAGTHSTSDAGTSDLSGAGGEAIHAARMALLGALDQVESDVAGPWRAAAEPLLVAADALLAGAASAWVGAFDFGEVPLPPGKTKSERDLIRAYRLFRRMLRSWAQAQVRAGAPRIVSPPRGQSPASGLAATPRRPAHGRAVR